MPIYPKYIKRILDFLLAAIAFLLLSPIFLICIIILAFSNKGTPFFTQFRPGKDGRIFKIIKFKTMNDRKDTQGQLLPDADRITPLGQFIRKNSLDEIPQLLNVIKGDMSLIGPRPLLVQYLPLYNEEQSRRHNVRPGITGWAQVNGRNAISWEKKFELDVWYVSHLSFLLDMKILFLTVKKVSIREGINQKGQVTIKAFKGSRLK